MTQKQNEHTIGSLARTTLPDDYHEFRQSSEFEGALGTLFEDERIVKYGAILKVRNSENTFSNYMSSLKLYEEFSINEGNDLVSSKKNVRNFADMLAFRGNCIGTIDIRLSAIRSFFNFLEDELEIDTPSISHIEGEDYKARVSAETERLGIPREDVRQLINTGSNTRDTLIIAMFYYTAMRREELEQVNLEDIDYDALTIDVIGKGNKPRTVPYSEHLEKLLKRWVDDVRPHYPASDSQALFLSESGGQFAGRLSHERLYATVVDAAENSGLQKKIGTTSDGRPKNRIHPHILRHSLATHMVQDGVPLRYIARILGHSSIETTRRYAKDAKKDIFNSYHERYQGI